MTWPATVAADVPTVGVLAWSLWGLAGGPWLGSSVDGGKAGVALAGWRGICCGGRRGLLAGRGGPRWGYLLRMAATTGCARLRI